MIVLKKSYFIYKNCYDKTLINITKENQTKKEERKTIFSKLIKYYSEKFECVKQLIDKKIENL